MGAEWFWEVWDLRVGKREAEAKSCQGLINGCIKQLDIGLKEEEGCQGFYLRIFIFWI